MIQLVLHGRISERIIEQIIEAPVPQIWEHCVEAMIVILQERLQLRTGEQIVDAPAPHDGKMIVAETDDDDQPGVLIQRGCSDEG